MSKLVAYDKNKEKPSSYDYRPYLMPIRNQGNQNSCWAFVLATVKEIQEKMDQGFHGYYSPQFIYNQRNYFNDDYVPEDDPDEDYGMYSWDALDILKRAGICKEEDYPYMNIQKTGQIPLAIKKKAYENRIEDYFQIDTLQGVKDCLLYHGPVAITVRGYNFGPFMWRKQSRNDKIIFRHAMVLVGYDDKYRSFIVRNSWGTDWAWNGYSYLPYDEFNEPYAYYKIVDYVNTPRPKPTDNLTQDEKFKLIMEYIARLRKYLGLD